MSQTSVLWALLTVSSSCRVVVGIVRACSADCASQPETIGYLTKRLSYFVPRSAEDCAFIPHIVCLKIVGDW
jgi:hypothetical protein